MAHKFNRRALLAGAATLASAPMLRGRSARADKPIDDDAIDWYDPRDWGVEGRGFDDTPAFYNRLPKRAQGRVRDKVFQQSLDSTGMCVRFDTEFTHDADALYVRYETTNGRVGGVGGSGLDLYMSDDQGYPRWLYAVSPPGRGPREQRIGVFYPARRTVTLYLPMHNTVKSLQVGVAKRAMFEPLAPRKKQSILFYGTSIIHGVGVSRPGMAFPSILGRRLDCPTYNFGFGGNGRMESEVMRFLVEIDPAVHVIDCVPNIGPQEIRQRCVPLVKQIRAANGETPVVLVEGRAYANAQFFRGSMTKYRQTREAMQAAYAQLQKDRVKNVLYLPADNLLGDDGEATVDGSHPSDLGMMRYADAYEPVLRRALDLL